VRRILFIRLPRNAYRNRLRISELRRSKMRRILGLKLQMLCKKAMSMWLLSTLTLATNAS